MTNKGFEVIEAKWLFSTVCNQSQISSGRILIGYSLDMILVLGMVP